MDDQDAPGWTVPALAGPRDAAPRAGSARALLVLLAGMAVLIMGALAAGGEPARFALASVAAAPFILLAGFVQLSDVWRPARWLAWVWFWLLLLALGLLALSLTFGALLPAPGAALPADAVPPLRLAIGVITSGLLVGILLVASGLWQVLAGWLGARVARSDLAAELGVVGLAAFTLMALAPLVALRGEAPLLKLLEVDANALSDGRSSGGQVLDLYYTLAWTIPLALVGAGFPTRRTAPASLARLGILPLRRRDLPVLLGIAAALVALGFGLDWAIGAIWTATGWPRTDPELVNRLFAEAMSPFGAASAAVTAGLGEELIARGLVQPRLGWLLPNLAFAATHAFQYGPDAVVSVFVVGAVLALVRARWNTSASALVHGLYDGALFFGSLLGLHGF